MAKVSAPLECFFPVRKERTRTVISYGLDIGTPLASWHEVYLSKRNYGTPTLDVIKKAVIADIDAQTDERILSGFVWEAKPVWLSRENEFNFKAAYDLAVQTNGANLPLKFKLGEEDDGTPVYHTFRSLNSLQDFYTQAIAYIQQCLQQGWDRKDGIDWAQYAPQE